MARRQYTRQIEACQYTGVRMLYSTQQTGAIPMCDIARLGVLFVTLGLAAARGEFTHILTAIAFEGSLATFGGDRARYTRPYVSRSARPPGCDHQAVCLAQSAMAVL
jgi:hypothetical protein